MLCFGRGGAFFVALFCSKLLPHAAGGWFFWRSLIRDQMILDLSGTVEDAFKGFRYIVTIGDLVWSFSGTATPITAVTVLSTLWKYAIDEFISLYQIRNQQKAWVHFGRHSHCGLKHPLHLLQ